LLGLARGVPPDPPPEAPVGVVQLRLSSTEPHPAGSPLPVIIEAVMPLGSREPRWVGRVPGRLRIDAWPGRVARRGERWLVRGRLVQGARGPLVVVRRPHHAVVVERRRGAAMGRARERVRAAVERGATPATQGLLLALALGDRARLPDSLREAFARTGTAHLVAISGLHVGSVGALALSLARRPLRRLGSATWRASGRGDVVAAGLGWTAAALYVLLAGAPVSGRRALVMLGVAGLAWGLRRRASGANVLAAAAGIVGWLDPSAVRGPGLQLSVASVAGLLALPGFPPGPHAVRWTGRARRALTMAVAGSVAGTLATAPLCSFWFGRVGIAGLWTNVIAIPLLGPATVPPLLLGAVLAQLDVGLGALFVRLASLPAGAGIAVVLWLAEPARAPQLLGSLPLGVTLLVYAGCLAIWRRGRR
jgi:competence protein ComEC